MSAQGYTNKIRAATEGRLTKVQFPGKVAVNNNPIQASVRLSPNFTTNNYTISKCSIPTFNELNCGEKLPVVYGEVVLTSAQQINLGMNTSSFFFVINRNAGSNTNYRYNPVTNTYIDNINNANIDSNSGSGASWGRVAVSSFIGLPLYTRLICLTILNSVFSLHLTGTGYSLEASVDSDYHLIFTLTPPVPVQTPSALRYIGLFFGNADNGSANLGITSPTVSRTGVTGSAFMLAYDPAQASNAFQTIRSPYVFLDFIP